VLFGLALLLLLKLLLLLLHGACTQQIQAK
jgi:hypothetical protein